MKKYTSSTFLRELSALSFADIINNNIGREVVKMKRSLVKSALYLLAFMVLATFAYSCGSEEKKQEQLGDKDIYEAERDLLDVNELQEQEEITQEQEIDYESEQEFAEEIVELEKELEPEQEIAGDQDNEFVEQEENEPEPEVDYEKQFITSFPTDIPDGDPFGIWYEFTIAQLELNQGETQFLIITVEFNHQEMGDLKVVLYPPNANSTVIYDGEQSGAGGTVNAYFNDIYSELGVSDFENGVWYLQIIDEVPEDSGTVENIEIETGITAAEYEVADGDAEFEEYVEFEDAETTTENEEAETQPARGVLAYLTDFTSAGYLYFLPFGENGFEEPVPIKNNVHTDAYLSATGNTAFLIERLGADRITAYSTETSVPQELFSTTVGNGNLNAQDAAVGADGFVYVSRYSSNELLIVNTTTGNAVGTIDLSNFADDADGFAELSAMLRVGNLLLIQAQALDANNWYAPYGISWLVAVDSANATVVDLNSIMPGVQGIRLPARNPFGEMRLLDNTLYVNLAENAYSADTGSAGIWKINLQTLQPAQLVVSEDDVNGGIIDFAIATPNRLIAIVSTASFTTQAVAYNPEDQEFISVVWDQSAWDLNDVETDGNYFFLATESGIKVFDVESLEERAELEPTLPENLPAPKDLLVLPVQPPKCISDATCIESKCHSNGVCAQDCRQGNGDLIGDEFCSQFVNSDFVCHQDVEGLCAPPCEDNTDCPQDFVCGDDAKCHTIQLDGDEETNETQEYESETESFEQEHTELGE